MPRVAILHAYSADNIGDGFLVDNTLALLDEAFGGTAELTLFAHKPASFGSFRGRLVSTAPSRLLLPRFRTLRQLRRLRDYDLIVGVGGGYFRFGDLQAATKCAIIHLPQLLAAGSVGRHAIYLPQSVGPLRLGTTRPMRWALGRLGRLLVRDDRSLNELCLPNVERWPDLALMRNATNDRTLSVPEPPSVLSVRPVRGGVPQEVRRLADLMRPFFGFVQSTTGTNDDRDAMASLAPARYLSRDEMHGHSGPRRIVVAVRLHAALLAMGAGHYVIHLSYERKGFGAFGDLGLADYVHNVFQFDADVVFRQVRALESDERARLEYDEVLRKSAHWLRKRREDAVKLIRASARSTDPNPKRHGERTESRP